MRDPREKVQLHTAMRALAGGDRSAARTVFDILWPRVLGFCLKALGHHDPSLAEDVAQKSLMQLFGKVTEFDPSRDALAWALQIAVWECRSEHRRRMRSKETSWETLPNASLPESAESESESPEQTFERQELRRALDAAMENLSPQDQETLLAVAFEQTSTLPPATWRKRKERAVMRLKMLWKVLYGND